MAPPCRGLNRLSRAAQTIFHQNRLPRASHTILYQNHRLCHQKPQAQYDHIGPNSASGRPLHGDRELPVELMRNVVKLRCKSTAEGGVCDVHVVGTNHVSEYSFREVKAIVNLLKPQVVFLELCSKRARALSTKTLKIPTTSEMIYMWRKKCGLFLILISWFYAQVGAKLRVVPGSEFRIAYEEASKYGGKVILGDRPVEITIQSMWGNMPLWPTIKAAYNLLSHDPKFALSEMDDSDAIALVIQEMSKKFPTLVETLVHERDRYMSCKLLEVAKEHRSVVAVVGRGHLEGIKKNWGQPVSLEDLLKVPEKKPGVSAMKIITAVVGVGVVIMACR